MPQRFLKPGIVSSKKWDGLSWIGQSFYVRLIPLVDDFGRYQADPVLLRNQCFPLREDIRTSQVLELCHEVAGAQLAIFYKADGKNYVQLTNWTERARYDESIYPECRPDAVLLYGSVYIPCCEQYVSKSVRSAAQRGAARRSAAQLPTSTSTSTSTSVPTHTPTGGAEAVSVKIDTDYAREQGAKNSPTLAQATVYFAEIRRKHPECDYTPADVKAAFLTFEATQDAFGNWYWGKKLVGDWRAAMEARMSEAKERKHANSNATNKQRPDRNQGTTNEGSNGKYGGLGKVVKT